MNTDESTKVIAELQNDIAVMQNIVLYYQNRILNKQIAIEEIIQGKACKAAIPIRIELSAVTKPIPVLVTPVTPAAPAAPAAPVVPTREPTVSQLVRAVLPEFNGGPIDYKKLRKLVFTKYPQYKGKMMGSFYGTCQTLVAKGIPIQFPPPSHGPNRVQNRVNGEDGVVNGSPQLQRV